MNKEIIDRLHPANISMENKAEIENLSIEELGELAETYRNQIRTNLFEVRDTSNGQTFYAHYGSLIYHKKNRVNFEFEVTNVFPNASGASGAPSAPIATKKVAEKVVPATPLEVATPAPLEDKDDATASATAKQGEEATTQGTTQEGAPDIKALRQQYKAKFGKAVPVKEVNNIDFIIAKLAE